MRSQTMEAVVIGASAGGVAALEQVLAPLPSGYPLPVVVVQHVRPAPENHLAQLLDRCCTLPAKEADEKEIMRAGCLYVAPPGYHLLVERDRSFSLCAGERVSYSRPSIDVLFESAAETFRQRLVGVILTGANADGARGLARIVHQGGKGVVQDPHSAAQPEMPRAALKEIQSVTVLSLPEIAEFLAELGSVDKPPGGPI